MKNLIIVCDEKRREFADYSNCALLMRIINLK